MLDTFLAHDITMGAQIQHNPNIRSLAPIWAPQFPLSSMSSVHEGSGPKFQLWVGWKSSHVPASLFLELVAPKKNSKNTNSSDWTAPLGVRTDALAMVVGQMDVSARILVLCVCHIYNSSRTAGRLGFASRDPCCQF